MTAKKLSVFILLGLVAIFIIVVATTSALKGASRTRIADNSILVIDLERDYPERILFQFDIFGRRGRISFYRLLRSIYAAADDHDVDAILLKGYSMQGLARSWELAQALRHFKESKKPIYGYFEIAGASNLLLSGLCDTVAMPPQGEWIVPGFLAHLLFLRGTFEKLGIEFDVVQLGKYKGAGEMLTNDSMSVWMKESYNKLLDDLFTQYTDDCAKGLDMPVDSIRKLIDTAILQASDAQEFGLIDTIVFWQDFKEELAEDDADRLVSVRKYAGKSPTWGKADKTVALVIAEGSITSEDGRWSKGITAEKYAKALRKLAEDDDVDAIVIRVDSPGGSALASDIIHREVKLAAGKKPLYVSMSHVAASGGYYISMAADTILATPYTITGSIGVIMVKPHFTGTYEKIGAHPQTLKRGNYADMFIGDHPMSKDEHALFKRVLGDIYDQFISKAAAGRDTSIAWIDSVGQGRVWSAAAAESLALVDDFGSLWDAIALAERAVGVPEGEHARIIIKPRPGGFWELAESFSDMAISSLAPELLREKMALYELAEQLAGRPLYLWAGNVQCE